MLFPVEKTRFKTGTVLIETVLSGDSLYYIKAWRTLALCYAEPHFDEHNMKQCIKFAYILDFAYLFFDKFLFLNYEIVPPKLYDKPCTEWATFWSLFVKIW